MIDKWGSSREGRDRHGCGSRAWKKMALEPFKAGAQVIATDINGRELHKETGKVDVVSYVVVDGVGTVIDPEGIKGQVQGGVAQGFGQILMEETVHEAGSGQLLTGSFMDYAMPRASDIPFITIESRPVPTKANPLG